MYVYALFSENGLPFYIGSGSKDRWLWYDRKFGVSLPKIKIQENLTSAQAGELEKILITVLRDLLINKIVGGKHSPHSVPRSTEHAKKISNAKTGRKFSVSHRTAISAAQTGRKLSEDEKSKRRGWKHTEEAKEKIGARSKELWDTGVLTGGSWLGRKHTDETKQKLRDSAIGRSITPEAKIKMSAAKKGKPWTEARRLAMRDQRG